jgi:hypothetical protein
MLCPGTVTWTTGLLIVGDPATETCPQRGTLRDGQPPRISGRNAAISPKWFYVK